MSGWIKFEKDLQMDPRVLRMAKALEMRNAGALQGVTLVCGALVRLWCIADSHVGDDDVLDLSAAHVDELLGIPGFCELLPADWMEIGDGVVKLPGFHAHNGTAAKKRAVTAKRVAAHRSRNARSVTRPRPRPDQDQTIGRGEIALAADAAPTPPPVAAQGPNRKRRGTLGHFVPENWTVPIEEYRWALEQGYPPEVVKRETERFTDHEFKTPRSDWVKAWRNWITRDPPKGARNGASFRAA